MRRAITSVFTPNSRLCINCKHFIGDSVRWPDPPDHSTLGKCRLFGKQDLVTGETLFEYASIVRNREGRDVCGVNGKFYEPLKTND